MAEPPDPSAASQLRALLARHGLRPDKGFGQNFLIDRSALSAVVRAGSPGTSDVVLEVGPGLGTLTRALAAQAQRVIAVEADARILPALQETTGHLANVEVVHGDAMRFDHASVPKGALLISNLPYGIATALIRTALVSGRYARLAVLVQLEVAQRIAAEPGDAGFGAYSLIVRHFASARIVKRVPPGAFLPPPKVTSAVVKIDPKPGVAPDPVLFAWLRCGFRHRRKTLRRNLIAAGVEGRLALHALAEEGLSDKVRAEALDLPAWRSLAARLAALGLDPPQDGA